MCQTPSCAYRYLRIWLNLNNGRRTEIAINIFNQRLSFGSNFQLELSIGQSCSADWSVLSTSRTAKFNKQPSFYKFSCIGKFQVPTDSNFDTYIPKFTRSHLFFCVLKFLIQCFAGLISRCFIFLLDSIITILFIEGYCHFDCLKFIIKGNF